MILGTGVSRVCCHFEFGSVGYVEVAGHERFVIRFVGLDCLLCEVKRGRRGEVRIGLSGCRFL